MSSVSPLTILSRDLIKAGVQKSSKLTDANWDRYVSKVYATLFPKEKAVLEVRARTKGNGKPSIELPTNVYCMAKAMDLPIRRVRDLYPSLAPEKSVQFKLFLIANKLKATIPQRFVIRQNYKKVSGQVRRKQLKEMKKKERRVRNSSTRHSREALKKLKIERRYTNQLEGALKVTSARTRLRAAVDKQFLKEKKQRRQQKQIHQ